VHRIATPNRHPEALEGSTPMAEFKPNTLYYGDNLQVLRDFPTESVDLIYLDPPFNSNRNYNVLFKESSGTEAEAQI
jgi:site-specific DNA-methyltransferase (adenine-specific)